MKRHRIDLADIAIWDNLQLAAWKAAKGKRFRPVVAEFFTQLDSQLAQLQKEILAERVPCGTYRSFVIHDPKRRRIHAACFVDRVLHHAIMNQAEPIFERSLVNTTYACRPRKGVHHAVAQVQRNLQRYAWYVQVDVNGYFPAIDHETLLHLLSRRFKGDAFQRLLKRIVCSYQSVPGKGLPIGSLTSQHFANYYLDGADRFLLDHPAVCAHIRYMDDILWWCGDKQSARQVLFDFRCYMEEICKLRLKSTERINRSVQGMTYCGFRILPGTIRLTARKKHRYRQLRQYYEAAWLRGDIECLDLQFAYDAVLAATLPTQSIGWRQLDLQIHPSVYNNISG